jgi:DNA helicase-2/ATP-dependent DNA helicase PcrA
MLTEKETRRFWKARRRAIESTYPGLNAEQKKAVLATEGPLLLLAGAGSGKTTVLIHRVAHLLRFGSGADTKEVPDVVTAEDIGFLEAFAEGQTPDQAARAQRLCAWDVPAPWNILAITFTNKAAGELKERLEKQLGPVALDVWAYTFHSLCVKILRRDIDRMGISTNFTIYDTDDSLRVIKDVLERLRLDAKRFEPRKILGAIGRAKDHMEWPDDLMDQAEKSGNLYQKQVARVYGAYQAQMKEANALDFDDLIVQTVVLLQRFDEVRLFYQKKFRYVMVDEYQDTNHVQYLLTSILAGGYENICVVGDDDQSIYKFRGATIENILSFEKQYRDARVIRLEQNYRSTQTILTAANQVIAHNTERKGKNLWTDQGAGEPIVLYAAATEEEEAQYVMGKLLEAYREQGRWGGCAILYRLNAQSRVLENACRRNGIPYRVFGGMQFYDRAEVKDMTSYLCVISNPSDDLRLRRILNRPVRGIGEKTVDTAVQLAAQAHCSLWEVLAGADAYPELRRAAPKIRAFVEMMEKMTALSQTVPLPDFYEELMVQSGYIKMLREKNTPENKTREQNVRELKSSLLDYQQRTTEEGGEPTLADFLNEIALFSVLDEGTETEDYVSMMTVHSAKGLEFPTVFLVGMEEGIFPGIQAIGDPEEMEEARRLCYVAITRAKKELVLTCARYRTLMGRTMNNRVSRFAEEIPPSCLTRLGQEARQASYGSEGEEAFENPVRAGFSAPFSAAPFARPLQKKQESRYEHGIGSAKPKTKTIAISVGDEVMHKGFGRGKVLSVQQMGGDALLEIQFEQEKKRLMAKAALRQMELL